MGNILGSYIEGVSYSRRKLSGCSYVGAIFIRGNRPGVIAGEKCWGEGGEQLSG